MCASLVKNLTLLSFYFIIYLMKRLDVLLFEKGCYASREKAKQAVESGRVFLVGGKVVLRPSFLCEEDCELQTKPFEFVSRGGFKLQKAVEEFGLNFAGKVVLDIGASTGGFTDVCLQNGASKVYAVDTGEGQLASVVKNNPKVVNMEKTNFLSLPIQQIFDVQTIVIDVSFVSITKLVEKLAAFENVEVVALIKPQFEVGQEYARKHKGVVKDEKVHQKVVQNILKRFEEVGFKNFGVITSPIKGGDGNTEFLAYFKK